MKQIRTLPFVLTVGLLVVLIGGCSSITGVNPFKKKEKLLPGDRQAVLPQAANQVTGGTPAVGGATAMADWSQAGGNAANAPGNVSLGGTSGAAVWRVRVIESAGKRNVRPAAPPLVYGGRIFVYDAGGTVTVAFAGRRPAMVGVAGARGREEEPHDGRGHRRLRQRRSIAASGFGELVALDAASGNRIWAFKMGAPARSAPTASGGKVFVVSATNVLYAVNAADGTEAWQYPGIPESAGVLSAASPAASGDIVVVPYSSGEVIAFNAATGDAEMGRRRHPLDAHAWRCRASTDVAASPVIYEGVVYATGVSGRTIAVRLSDGERAVGAEYRQRLDARRFRQRDLHRRPAGRPGRA